MRCFQAADTAAHSSKARWAADLERLAFERENDVLADAHWPGSGERAHFGASPLTRHC